MAVGITVTSQKGGVGKTTVALNLAYALGRRGWSTLLVDTDPTGAIGYSLSQRLAKLPGLSEMVSGEAKLSDVIVDTRLNELSLLPVGQVSALKTAEFQNQLADGRALSELMTQVDADYDLVVFDTPSGFTGSTLGALWASEHAIIPVQAEPIAARGLLKVLDLFNEMNAAGAQVKLAGMVVSMLNQQDPSSVAVAQDLWKKLPAKLLFRASVSRDPAFLAASAAGVPVGLLRRRTPPVALVFDQLAAELEARVELGQDEEPHEPIALVD